ncbi:carboxymuconolactone decarboxylase family protein [Pseudochelatococcus sp. B33]
MARLELPVREKLSTEEQSAYDHIMGSRGHIGGPFTVLVYSPELGKRVCDVGAYVRFESDLPADLRTIAVMTVAREFNCRFEWAGWTKQAREAGVSERIIEAIRDRRPLENLTPDEQLVVSFGAQLMSPKHRVDKDVYDAAIARFGVKGTADLSATYGYFAMLSFTMNAFEVDVPEGEDVLPD